MRTISPPQSQQELLSRSRAIAGLTLAELAGQLDQSVPENLLQAKGWIGELLERRLGASAGSRAEQDFFELGIELKTIPVNPQGRPKESTYVCTVPLDGFSETSWETSWVRRKLSRVLWFPIEADPRIAVPQRRIGSAILWTPDTHQEACLRQDWEEHMELIQLGRLEEISAHQGTCLQIRPKAANRQALCPATDAQGNPVMTLPRGFYLRTSFTGAILDRYHPA